MEVLLLQVLNVMNGVAGDGCDERWNWPELGIAGGDYKGLHYV